MALLSYLLFALAIFCNAVCDTLREHYKGSIFESLHDPKEFDGSISWKNKYIDGEEAKGLKPNKFFRDGLSDGWHLFKAFQWLFTIGSIVTYSPVIIPHITLNIYLTFGIKIITYITIWISIFDLNYNYLLRKR